MAGVKSDRAAVAIAKRSKKGNSTARTPILSISLPRYRSASAVMMFVRPMPDAITPRPMCKLSEIGLMKTPVQNTSTAPCPKIRARNDATTIHHLLLNIFIKPALPY